MEVVLIVSEAELEEFPEEATESSGQQKQPNETSQIQGTVKSLLSVEISPTADMVEKLRQGKVSYVTGITPKGGSIGCQEHKVFRQPDNCHSKRLQLLVIKKPIVAHKRPGHLNTQ